MLLAIKPNFIHCHIWFDSSRSLHRPNIWIWWFFKNWISIERNGSPGRTGSGARRLGSGPRRAGTVASTFRRKRRRDGRRRRPASPRWRPAPCGSGPAGRRWAAGRRWTPPVPPAVDQWPPPTRPVWPRAAFDTFSIRMQSTPVSASSFFNATTIASFALHTALKNAFHGNPMGVFQIWPSLWDLFTFIRVNIVTDRWY